MVMLSPWDKLVVVGCGLGVVAIALVLVICVIAPFCPLHRLLPEGARIPISSPIKKRKKPWLLTGNFQLNNENSEKAKLKNGSTYISYSQEIRNPENSPPEACKDDPKQTTNGWSADTSVTLRNANVPMTGTHSKRPSILATRESTVDSTYSSMTPTGSRPSTPVSSKSDVMLPDSISNLGDTTSNRSVDVYPIYGSVTVSLQLCATSDDNVMKFIIGIKEAQDLPARDNVACGDPFFRVRIIKENTKAFRKRSKSRVDVISEFITNVQKKTRHPIYNQNFETRINKADIKDCEIHLIGFDKDKYANPTEFGFAVMHLKNLKLPPMGNPVTFCFELTEPKRINGEIQFGLMYLPTAERMSFSNFKLTNISINSSTFNDDPRVFIRVMLLYNGKLAGKKKTEVVKHNPTAATSFNDSLAFDVPTDQMNHLSFVIVVVTLDNDNETSPTGKSKKIVSNQNNSDTESTMTDSGVSKEKFIGKITLGANSKSTGLQHWEIAIHRPREQIVLWHVLR